MSTAKFVKQAVPFGISHVRVGAILVHNFRIRTKMHSALDNELNAAAQLIAQAIRDGFASPDSNASHTRSLGKNGCVIHDFTSVGYLHEFNIIKGEVLRAMLEADVIALNTKYAGLRHYVSINKLPTHPEYEPTEADCWDGDGAEL